MKTKAEILFNLHAVSISSTLLFLLSFINKEKLSNSKKNISPEIIVLDKENGGKASAMNLSLSKSKSELIGCLDADSFVKPNALLLIAKQFMKDDIVGKVDENTAMIKATITDPEKMEKVMSERIPEIAPKLGLEHEMYTLTKMNN